MEREVPFFCGEAVVSYRVANVTELERKASPPCCFALFRFAFRCFVSLRVASLCFVLLRVAPLCFLGAVWARFGFSICLALLRFGLLCFALLRFVLLGSAWPSLCFASFRFVLLGFSQLCFALLLENNLCAFWERSGIVLGASGALF